jgi:hypothetical protein
VNGTRPNYADLLTGIRREIGSNSIYAYYMTSGFASFWPEVSDVPATILNNIVNGVPVKFDGNIYLPQSDISCEPLLHAVFELKSNPRLIDLAKNVYLAHEANYTATGGQYVAFSEGNSGSRGFIYEWVVLSNGAKWTVTDVNRNVFENFNPIIYTKVAMSFLALYNTTYSRDMVVYLEKSLPEPTFGYSDGADYSAQSASRTLISQTGSNTNGLILEAVRYAIQK